LKQGIIFEEVSLPKEQSKDFTKPKQLFQKKELTEKQKSWLKAHEESNWKEIILSQEYKTSKGVFKKLFWRLPGTSEKRDYCGIWNDKGCAQVFDHPENKYFVRHVKRSCFRASCEYCWLEKWLARESTRATKRIKNYKKVFKELHFVRHPGFQRKYLKEIHVIVSPPWKEKFGRFDLLKAKARFLLEEAGVEGGLMIYHPCAYDKKLGEWVKRPHFHGLGFGWVVDTKKICDESGWVIKNKGLRNSVHSTIYYLLSHVGVAKGVQSIIWFGSLGYRAKYANRFKVIEVDKTDYCDFCHALLVEFDYVGQDRPPDYEFVGLVDVKDWNPLETLAEAEERRKELKNRKRNPRKGFVNDGQGIASNYSSFLEKFNSADIQTPHADTAHLHDTPSPLFI